MDYIALTDIHTANALQKSSNEYTICLLISTESETSSPE